MALAGRVMSTKRAGGAEGIRTPDLINAIDALSQLSYSPTEKTPPKTTTITPYSNPAEKR